MNTKRIYGNFNGTVEERTKGGREGEEWIGQVRRNGRRRGEMVEEERRERRRGR